MKRTTLGANDRTLVTIVARPLLAGVYCPYEREVSVSRLRDAAAAGCR
jgi:hypothetical protein